MTQNVLFSSLETIDDMSDQALLRKIIATELEESLLQYKQMELDSLLEVTKAINANSSEENLFKIYGFILQAQMKVNRLVVLYKVDDNWKCMHKIGAEDVSEKSLTVDESWSKIQESVELEDTDLELKEHFDYLLPISHKSKVLAFVLLGKLEAYLNDSLDNRLNFIQTITNIIVVAIENKRLFRQQIEQERMEREMELAAKVQNMLVPNVLPKDDHVNIDAIYMPHFNIGGDYYDVVKISDNEWLVCMADVSGKGISAALLMSNFQANLRVLAKEVDISLIDLVDKLNNRVAEITHGDRFLTFFVAKYYIAERKLEYINAGHPPPVLSDAAGVQQRLGIGTTIIGAFDKLPFIKQGCIENMPANSKLVLFTDGLTDLENEQGELFEEDRILEFIQKQPDQSAQEFNEALLSEINEFRGTLVYTDDITVLSWKFH